MASTGFFKGEKKKSKKDKTKVGSFSASSAPTFVLPKMIEKKKRES